MRVDDDNDPWAGDLAGCAAIERELRTIVGLHLRRVRYVEMPLDYDGPAWSHPEFDAFDYGLELDLDDQTWSAIWKLEGGFEGLALGRGPLVPERLTADHETLVDDVTTSSRWSPLVGARITGVDVEWLDCAWWDGSRTAHCVRAVALAFGTRGSAVIALGRAGGDDGDTLEPSADTLVVVFGLEDARRLGAWRGD